MKSFQIFKQFINCIIKIYINGIGKEELRAQVFHADGVKNNIDINIIISFKLILNQGA